MRIVILTGTSGAGKITSALYFGDIGYFAVDNVPPRLLPALAETCAQDGHEKLLCVIDVRAGAALGEVPGIAAGLREAGIDVEILFLDASDEVLVRRFKETRRPHPCYDAARGSILEAIQTERVQLADLRTLADRIIDTSTRSPGELRTLLAQTTGERSHPYRLLITVESFGFKYGIPIDADLVLDVRFLNNPFYVPELRPLTGRDDLVAEFVHHDPLFQPFLEHVLNLVRFTLPHYEEEGKAYLTIAIGCTGGRHRSVALAEAIAKELKSDDRRVAILHRDVRSPVVEIEKP